MYKYCNILNSNGYNCGIYANQNWLYNNLNSKLLSQKYAIWLAKWPYEYAPSFSDAIKMTPNYNYTNYKIWQFSSKGSIDGISGNVDVDIGYDIFD